MNRKQPLEEEIADILYGHRMPEWPQIRPLAQWMVYFDPETNSIFAYGLSFWGSPEETDTEARF